MEEEEAEGASGGGGGQQGGEWKGGGEGGGGSGVGDVARAVPLRGATPVALTVEQKHRHYPPAVLLDLSISLLGYEALFL